MVITEKALQAIAPLPHTIRPVQVLRALGNNLPRFTQTIDQYTFAAGCPMATLSSQYFQCFRRDRPFGRPHSLWFDTKTFTMTLLRQLNMSSHAHPALGIVRGIRQWRI